jgi:hypothetical protein
LPNTRRSTPATVLSTALPAIVVGCGPTVKPPAGVQPVRAAQRAKEAVMIGAVIGVFIVPAIASAVTKNRGPAPGRPS